MTGSRRTNVGTWLGVGIVALVLLSALLLVSLCQAPDVRRPTGAGRPDAAIIAPSRRVSPHPRRAPLPHPAAVDGGVTPKVVRRAVTALDMGPATREPMRVHMAPAAVPSSIEQEKDPARRAQLLKMHRLAVARSRASRLRRRLRQLETTLVRARQEKNWTTEQVNRTERDIGELREAVIEAEHRVQRAEAGE